ncbi:glycoside hydrolase family 3 C-terminal domain-containing protein [Streptomyces sp. DG1A-41]|uniref:glycoside hydrolase family 3 C-terminal domain-containing protein n=1 Tax=Streptomyces sp. DG1A-41 TaxID=3125779 RepID=UPI0030D2A3DD
MGLAPASPAGAYGPVPGGSGFRLTGRVGRGGSGGCPDPGCHPRGRPGLFAGSGSRCPRLGCHPQGRSGLSPGGAFRCHRPGRPGPLPGLPPEGLRRHPRGRPSCHPVGWPASRPPASGSPGPSVASGDGVSRSGAWEERLIEAVTAANPRTTVVLNTSSATAMPWPERTGAVLQMHYPGPKGAATAAVLFGDRVPPHPELPGRRRSPPRRRGPPPLPGRRRHRTQRASTSATAGTTPRTYGRCSPSATDCRTRPSPTRTRTRAGRPTATTSPSRSATPARATAWTCRRCRRDPPRTSRSTSRSACWPGTGGSPGGPGSSGGSPCASSRGRCLLGPEDPRLGARHRIAPPVVRGVVTGSAAAAADERTGGRLTRRVPHSG